MNEVPQRIMRELGFCEEAIQQCTPTHCKISAYELTERLLDFEEGIIPDPNPVAVSSHQDEPPQSQELMAAEKRDQLVKSVVNMWIKVCCIQCRKEKRNQLNLNCGHIMYCESCVKGKQTCPLCLMKISHTKTVYHT